MSEGKKYSHLIDLRTGLGLTTRRAASVILPEAKLTDPLATAACLSDHPKSLLEHYPKASIRVLYEDRKIPPITTGLFAK
ncbi:MAG: thiamine biosynthesis lipoprotein [Akkermansiaceae bacterium]|jgi:thiamine biosynthesis lipoprotein